jgi:hypothetical protein
MLMEYFFETVGRAFGEEMASGWGWSGSASFHNAGKSFQARFSQMQQAKQRGSGGQRKTKIGSQSVSAYATLGAVSEDTRTLKFFEKAEQRKPIKSVCSVCSKLFIAESKLGERVAFWTLISPGTGRAYILGAPHNSKMSRRQRKKRQRCK